MRAHDRAQLRAREPAHGRRLRVYRSKGPLPMRGLLRHRMAALGLVVTGLFVLAAIWAPLLAPYPPSRQNLAEDLRPPSAAHPMGQDKLGGDLLRRASWGGPAPP